MDEKSSLGFSSLYGLGKILGKGAEGTVYKAVRYSDGKEFAVKIMEGKNMNSFLKEYNLLLEIKEACILQVFENYVEGDKYIVVMEYIGGYDLSRFMRNKYVIRASEYTNLCLKYMSQVYECINKLHSLGIVHRDIKLENIMLMNGHTKIIDFGFARSKDDSAEWYRVGTPDYISPSILKKELSFETYEYQDYWSICIALFILLHNDETPFTDQAEPGGEHDLKFLYRNIVNGNVVKNLFESNEIDDILYDVFAHQPKNLSTRLEHIFSLGNPDPFD